MIAVTHTNGTNSDFIQLTRLLDADLNTRYGGLQADYDQCNAIEQIDTVILVHDAGVLAGCGAIKSWDDTTIEIKRMFVLPEHRGKGIAGRILNELENWAAALGHTRSILETGIKQFEAIGLYENYGYKRIDNYGQYRDQPNSVCYEKFFHE